MRAVLLAIGVACTDTSDAPTSLNSEAVVYPVVAFTGFDGAARFRVPLVTNLVGAVTWSVEDPSIAEVAPAVSPPASPIPNGQWAMAVTRKPGATRVIATTGDATSTAMLIVGPYDAASVAAGGARYQTTADPMGPGRGCVTCHGQPQGADHSPTLMAYYDDAAILSVVLTGSYPDGRMIDQPGHAWNLTPAERAGIVPFLRSLPPRGF